MGTFISDQARIGDEGQSGSRSDDIGNFLPKEVGEIAEGAEDGKAGDKRRQAVGDADEEHVEDDVLVKASLFPMNTRRFATDLVELVEAGEGEHGGVASAEGEEDQIQKALNIKGIGTLSVMIIIAYMQKTCDVAEKAILAKKKLRKKCVNRDKM